MSGDNVFRLCLQNWPFNPDFLKPPITLFCRKKKEDGELAMLLLHLLCFVGTRSTLSIIKGAVWIDNPNVLLMST